MNQTKRYILDELGVIKKDCREKGISTREWIERYAEEYHNRYDNSSRNSRLTAPHP